MATHSPGWPSFSWSRFFGVAIYFLIGEKRLGYYRAGWARELERRFGEWRGQLQRFEFNDWAEDDLADKQLAKLVAERTGMLPLADNRLQLMDSAEQIFRALIDDIDAAKESCFLEYYIWEVGGLADDVAMALQRAADRGVDCRVLVDAVGSRGFLKSKQKKNLVEHGVHIREALPASLFRALFYRFDLRLHRKIVVIDGAIAYAGSQNMADPRKFQAGAGFGQWIDAMARIRGPAVDALAMTFYMDWMLESFDQESFDQQKRLENESQRWVDANEGVSAVQVLPSGPGTESDAINQALLTAIYMAQHRLFITSPYFVPDENLQTALLTAAGRGVEVTVLVPAKVNSMLVKMASRIFLRELAEGGVRVAQYEAGMLHTKSVVIDDDVCLFGSLNMDPRSLHLNFEITLLVYDNPFTGSLLELQSRYLEDSRIVPKEELAVHSFPVRVVENCIRLLSPLL